MSPYKFIINPEKKRFEMIVEGAMAVLYYDDFKPGVWVFNHVLVPEILKGKGIGSELLRQALTFCREKGIKVIPECSFVEAFFRRYPEWQDLLIKHREE